MTESIKFSEWIDKLCGVMIKMHYMNHRKLELRKQKPIPYKKLNELQTAIDNINEQRYAVWNEIEKTIQRMMKGEYKPQKEVRTYGYRDK
ncbi:MAG: hypothetical protein AABY15_01365 [Nanoarchaeota archaeon]